MIAVLARPVAHGYLAFFGVDRIAIVFEKRGGVAISDPVERYDGYLVGGFLDSEGNKLWFCSAA